MPRLELQPAGFALGIEFAEIQLNFQVCRLPALILRPGNRTDGGDFGAAVLSGTEAGYEQALQGGLNRV